MMKPMELLEIFANPTYKSNYTHAKATGTCIRCKKPAKTYRNASARLEYEVSALCQSCQDYYFKVEELPGKIN